MKFKSDIDIDFGNRDRALELLRHVPAGIIRDEKLVKHNTGVYVTEIPVDPFLNVASIDYQAAEDRGYTKLDFLNVSLYNRVKSEEHLKQLMTKEPEWAKLYEREFCEQLIHIGSHYDTLLKMADVVDTIPRMAMFLSIIRPAKRHLIGKPWAEIAKTVWERPAGDEYYFKKSHAVAYAHLVVVNMNLLTESSN